jgi:3-hydroxyacyl-CoA dehydrogenase
MSASYEVRGSVAVITMNNPPVNGLGFATRQGLAAGLEQAWADPAVKAVVITGGGRAFSGGADIKDSAEVSAEPNCFR